MSTRPQDAAHSKDKDKAVKSGPSSIKSNYAAGNRIQQQTGEMSAGTSRTFVGGKRVKNKGPMVLGGQLEKQEERIENQKNSLQELQRQKRAKMKADGTIKLWNKRKQKEQDELERRERLGKRELEKQPDMEARLERQEILDELVEREERLKELQRVPERKGGTSEEKRRGGQSILEKRELREPMPRDLVGHEGQYHSEEVIFSEMEMDWSEQSNDDELFDEVDPPDPDAYEDKDDMSAKFYQAQDPQPETTDDDDLRPRVPTAVTSATIWETTTQETTIQEASQMLFRSHRLDPGSATLLHQNNASMPPYTSIRPYTSMWLDTSMWSGTSMYQGTDLWPDTANMTNSLSEAGVCENQDAELARIQLQSLSLRENFVPTAEEMEQSVQPGDSAPFEDEDNLSPDGADEKAPTEFYQAQDPQPETIDDDDDSLRIRVPTDVTSTIQETPQMPIRSMSGGVLPEDDAPMWPNTASMIVGPSRADASEDQDAELARIQLEDRTIHQDIASMATDQSANGEALEDEGDLSPDSGNVKAPTEFYQAQDPQPETIEDDDLRPRVPTNVTSPAIEETLQMLLGGHHLDEVKGEEQ
ncbi:MAG: hypothetical protein J3Q66DRAFT_385816 [Benniella sp.]|nr:MAG: hypothetical protein J3Q66DRAFT_385816 [Benniella sp.]